MVFESIKVVAVLRAVCRSDTYFVWNAIGIYIVKDAMRRRCYVIRRCSVYLKLRAAQGCVFQH